MLVPLDAATDAMTREGEMARRLLKELGEEKVLLICRTRELAEEISRAAPARDQCELRPLPRRAHAAPARPQRRVTSPRRKARASCSARRSAAKGATSSSRIISCFSICRTNPGTARAAHRPSRPHRADGDDRNPRAVSAAAPNPKCSRAGITRGSNAFEKNPHGAAEIARALADELAALLARIRREKAHRLHQAHARTATRASRRNSSAATTACSS